MNFDFAPLEIHPDAEDALSVERPLFDWPGARWGKCLALYTYARRCTKGPIIELGTYHGCGSIALALGNRDGHQVPFYTIDPFVDYAGWIGGEHYYPQDLDVFKSNLEKLDLTNHVALIQERSEDVAQWFDDQYEFLFWDIGGSRLFDDYLDWYGLCALGGTIAVKDLTSWSFGFDDVAEHALENGFVTQDHFRPGCIWTLTCRGEL